MRIVLILALSSTLLFLTAHDSAVQARPKARYITVFMTFHDAGRGRPTSSGKRENANMVAQNRKQGQKGALPMEAAIFPRAYKDKKTGQWVKGNLPKRYIFDTMGPSARRKNYLWIDYYYTGQRSAWMERFNNTWVIVEIVD